MMNDKKISIEKEDFKAKLEAISDEDLKKECESKIWLSSYAGNNPRSNFHWKCDACYDECQRRGKPEIYKSAFRVIEKQVKG